MNDFWKSYDITHAELGPNFRCYPLYGKIHLIELALSLVFIVGMALWYRRSSASARRRILVGVTIALLADEAALLLGMALTGQWNWSYLPLHLCSINVFVCLYNTLTDQNWCKEELYALCIPGAALALLSPSWLDVPSWWTLINLHSISIHALLVLYPVLLVVRGYRPSARRAPQVLAFLFGSALPIYFLNKPLNTNFYFLNNPYGNVITSAFTRLLGEKYYILGFLPAIAVALCLMYLPWVVADARHIRENKCFLQAALSPPGRAAFCLPKTPTVCKLKLQISCVLRFVLTFLKSGQKSLQNPLTEALLHDNMNT